MTISKKTAEHYRQNSSVQFGLAQKILETFDFSQCASLLDVGCGDGKITEAMSKQAPLAKVVGVDLSPAMIDLARKNHPGISFETADASTLDLGQTFNCITCLCCLHWVRQPAEAISRMVHHLNPDGTLIILTFPNESPYYQIFTEALQEPRFKDFSSSSASETLLSIDEHREALTQAGLDIELFKVENNQVHYESSQAFIDYVKGWLPCWVDLPEKLQAPYLRRVADLAKMKWSENEGIATPYTMISLRAKKL